MPIGTEIPHDARLPLSSHSVNNLMSLLWERGYRPDGYKGTEGEIRRIEDHLKDARALNDKLLPLVVNAIGALGELFVGKKEETHGPE